MTSPDMSDVLSDEAYMQQALTLAAQAADCGEVPVGAIVVSAEGAVIGRGYNQPLSQHDPTAHAEVMALRDAAANIKNYRLSGCRLYVTIEPCSMCAGALVHARIAELIFGAKEPRAGVVCSQQQLLDSDWLNHRCQWRGGVLEEACARQMKAFFAARR